MYGKLTRHLDCFEKRIKRFLVSSRTSPARALHLLEVAVVVAGAAGVGGAVPRQEMHDVVVGLAAWAVGMVVTVKEREAMAVS
jgi:hypothetical protein